MVPPGPPVTPGMPPAGAVPGCPGAGASGFAVGSSNWSKSVEIKAINCVNNSINVITNKSYYKYSLDLDYNEIEKVTNKIESTNNTNKLEDLQDFIIDENFEIGYLAFQDRLKWFYF